LIVGKHKQLLDFFIVGVQKSGTTALDAYLKRSPYMQMAAVREIHFFDNENVDWSNPDYSRLTQHFSWSSDSRIWRGETTPIYIYWPQALERLQRYNPDAKLIVCLRHPACRAHSHWRMETKRQWESLPFELAISDQGRRRVLASENGAHRVYSYIERGFYARQISRLLTLFTREQTLFLRTDDLWRSPNATLGRVHQFLGAPDPGPIEREYIVPLETRDVGALSPEAFERLTKFYSDDIRETARLTGLSLTEWLSPDYVEPTSLH